MPASPRNTRRRPGIVLQNELEAPPALLEDWLREHDIAHVISRAWEGDVPDDPQRFGWVASLGSAHSVHQVDQEWITAEIAFLRDAVEAGVAVLGICFGGQALSVALGGEVSPAEATSIGWFEVETTYPEVVPAGPWAHFNSECFSVPDPSIELARSPCGPGAFRLGPHLGVQFHPEATPTIVDAWAESEHERLTRLGVDPRRLRSEGRRHGELAARQAFSLFDAWWALADGATSGSRPGRREAGR
jgi:GMP synthase-like glutamine amidotransferase